jgi:hypothetical protein
VSAATGNISGNQYQREPISAGTNISGNQYQRVPISAGTGKYFGRRLLAGCGGAAILLNLAEAFVSPHIKLAVCNRIFDAAILFMRMGTVGITAFGGEGPQFEKKTRYLIGDDVPKFKLPNSGRVNNVSTVFQLDQFR